MYDFISDSLRYLNMDQEYGLRSAAAVFSQDERVFIADNREGIFELKDDRLILPPGGNKIKWVKFLTLLPFGKEQLLVVTVDNGLFLYNYKTGAVKKDFLSDFDNDRLKGGLISSASIIPGNRIAVGVTGGDGVYIFDFNGVLRQQITAETTEGVESSVISMFCDYTSNSQLWFCTPGFINRAYVSLPVSEFGNAAGLKTAITDAKVFEGKTYVSGIPGLYVSRSDYDDRVRFSRMEGIDNQLSELLILNNAGKEILIAVTDQGLFQVDTRGSAKRVSENFNVTAVMKDRNDPSVILAGTSAGIVSRLKYTGNAFVRTGSPNQTDTGGKVKAIEQTADGEWWVLTGDPSGLCRLPKTAADSVVSYGRSSGLGSDTLNHIVTVGNYLYACTGKGVYRYNNESDSFERDNDLIGKTFGNSEILRLLKTPEGDLQVSGRDTRYFDALVTPTRQGHVVFRKQFDFLPDIPTTDIGFINGSIWIIKGKVIYIIDKSRLGYNYGSFRTFFTTITAGRDSVLMNNSFQTTAANGKRLPAVRQPEGSNPVLRHSLNDISFRWTTTFYTGEEKTEYRYKLEGFDSDWSKWERRNFKDYTNLPHGAYTFRLKSKTVTGMEGEETTFKFSVHRSWYQATTSRILYLLLGGFILFAILRLLTLRLRNENNRLRKLLADNRRELTLRKKEVESGLGYAARIQQALLPSEKILASTLGNHFILYKPRETVSGDYYWISRKEERLFVVVADCTGHGVPGAFMSLLGMSLLDEVINRLSLHRANEILTEMRKRVISSLKQPGESRTVIDVMDMGLLVVDYKRRKVEFAGANIPCFKVRALDPDETELWQAGDFEAEEGAISNGKFLLETVNASKMPVGFSLRMDQEFSLNEWELEKDVSFYLVTDGYSDQFNGVTGRKFMKRNLKKLLLDVQDFKMTRQKDILEERFNSWMGKAPQLDDVLIIGLRAE
jgi:serine phosphatase RsbU (regulator of sigma subunit)